MKLEEVDGEDSREQTGSIRHVEHLVVWHRRVWASAVRKEPDSEAPSFGMPHPTLLRSPKASLDGVSIGNQSRGSPRLGQANLLLSLQ